MRAAILLVLAPLVADAGGRLSNVSGAVREASSDPPSTSPPPSSSGPRIETPVVDDARDHRDDDADDDHHEVASDAGMPSLGLTGADLVTVLRPLVARTSLDGLLSAQAVHESQGAVHAALALEVSVLRLTASFDRYWERQLDGSTLAMSFPGARLGVRLSEAAATRVTFEGGLTFLETSNDPVMDTVLLGVTAGVHVEHPFRGVRLVVDAHAISFTDTDVLAAQARVGVRSHHVELGFRVLDFNVGPALYGPEVGVAF